MKKLILLLFLLSLFQHPCFTQTPKIDSLLNVLKTAGKDTNTIARLNDLSKEYLKSRMYPEALESASKAVAEAENISIQSEGKKDPAVFHSAQNSMALSYHITGTVFISQSDYVKALEYFFKSIETRERISLKHPDDPENKKGMASTYNNIGNIYFYQSDYPKALDYYFKSLKIKEALGDKKGVALSYNNLGSIFGNQSDFPKALENYFKSLKIFEEICGEKNADHLKCNKEFAHSYTNIANVYAHQSDYSKALEFCFKSINVVKEMGARDPNDFEYKREMANVCGNTASIYIAYYEKDTDHKGLKINTGNSVTVISHAALLDSALSLQSKALTINRSLKDVYSSAYNLLGIGNVYFYREKYREAVSYFKQAYTAADSVGVLDGKKVSAKKLSDSYNSMEDFGNAFKWYQTFIAHRDSIFNVEKNKELVSKELRFTYEKKALADSVRTGEEKKVITAQLKQEQTQRYALYGGLTLLCIFGGFMFNRFRVTQKQKKVIEIKNEETEKQKNIIEEKNKDIMDSIHYANRIQTALLKEEEHVTEHLPPHFILFKPKDVLSGDFYWSLEKQGHLYIAAADCTGHGVPGAMMSMLGIAFLNEITGTEKLQTPAEILNQLRDKIIQNLKSKDGHTKDGMDISFIRINLQTRELQWAGANNPLWMSRQGDSGIIEIKADKQPIGFYHEPKPFTNHEVSLTKDDTVYLFTDGYADQFGGEKGKKFKYSKLKELLISVRQDSVQEQKEILNATIESWKGNLEQVDDILVIGVRL